LPCEYQSWLLKAGKRDYMWEISNGGPCSEDDEPEPVWRASPPLALYRWCDIC